MRGDADRISVGTHDPDPEIALGAASIPVPGPDKVLGVADIHDPGPDEVGAGGSHDPGPDRGHGDARSIEASEGQFSRMSDHLQCRYHVEPQGARWPALVCGLAGQQHSGRVRGFSTGPRPHQ